MNMIGHNHLNELRSRASKLEVALLAVTSVDAANCGTVKDLIGDAKALAKEIEEARKSTKEPHLIAATAVDNAFNPLKEELISAWFAPNKMLEAWVIAEKKRADAIAEEARKKAEALAKEQEEEDAFLRSDEQVAVVNTEAAIARVRAAAASQVVSANGGRTASLKTYRSAEVTDAKALVLHYFEHPDVLGAATKCANAAIRAAKGGPISIPGIKVIEEQRLS